LPWRRKLSFLYDSTGISLAVELAINGTFTPLLEIGCHLCFNIEMAAGQRHETALDRLRLVVEEQSDHVHIFVYDTACCEVLYSAERISPDAGKLAAVEFAVAHLHGPAALNPEGISMLPWAPTRFMKIELLYIEGCPSVPATMDRISRILSEHNLSTTVVQIKWLTMMRHRHKDFSDRPHSALTARTSNPRLGREPILGSCVARMTVAACRLNL
jgi:hypothetical protein